jgi:hypothetical protein
MRSAYASRTVEQYGVADYALQRTLVSPDKIHVHEA